jgi:hypothetical protein
MVVKKMAGTPVPPVSVFTGASTLIAAQTLLAIFSNVIMAGWLHWHLIFIKM